ncbi:hypothetical protein ABT214_11005 [Micromonospora purpureochromogenes]|uniref:hypothetical protein n=1 Tax=Micromonospora purpureochromogenes TaxID=47872 RepID=UPI0033293318
MVQVDVFWSYAIGAGFGTAAARAAVAEPVRPLLSDRRFTTTVLFLSCVFAPSGLWLVWQFTGWETMHAAPTTADLPAWLVATFAMTNVTQGIVGYCVARHLWRSGQRYLSWLQMPLGYFAMFFVLAYGWDGTGYRRFFAPTTAAWRAGEFDPLGFLTSPVALTLYGMGVVLIPTMLWLQAGWWAGDGLARARAGALLLVVPFSLGLGTAAVATVALRTLGVLPGLLACAVLVVTVFHPRGLAGLLARAFPLTTRRSVPAPSAA